MKPKNIEQSLRRDEGEKLYAYADSEGYVTIGIGVLIDRDKGGGITKEESAYLFNNRLALKKAELVEKAPWVAKLDEVRFGVLLNMSYQMGVNGVLNFKKTMQYVKDGKYQAAASEMLNSTWAKQTPERAVRLSDQMATGEWQ